MAIETIYIISIMISMMAMVNITTHIGDNKMKIVHVQLSFTSGRCNRIKGKAGESSIKEAISKAVYHYLNCNNEAIWKIFPGISFCPGPEYWNRADEHTLGFDEMER